MKEKIFNTLEGLSILLDIIAGFIFNITLPLLAIATMGLLTVISFKFNTMLGVVVLIISLSYLRVFTR
ncbi:hypothetical protein [Tissierella pigra]|uniref:Uncharacterized protein n=1 Tax=Tissierella pigra TaxID=2607614 RepID=A0A6N7XIP5_9FIRM|nr:hypothetical protein [Tissierella pigra]MSU01909.1 hypothetical protein [Tissierella pigra]